MVARVLSSMCVLSLALLSAVLFSGCGEEIRSVNSGALVATPSAFTFPIFEERNLENGIEREIVLENNGTGPIELIEIRELWDTNNFQLQYGTEDAGFQQFPGDLATDSDGLPKTTLEPGDTIIFRLNFRPNDIAAPPVGSLSFRTNAASVTPDSLRDGGDRTLITIQSRARRREVTCALRRQRSISGDDSGRTRGASSDHYQHRLIAGEFHAL